MSSSLAAAAAKRSVILFNRQQTLSETTSRLLAAGINLSRAFSQVVVAMTLLLALVNLSFLANSNARHPENQWQRSRVLRIGTLIKLKVQKQFAPRLLSRTGRL